MVLKTPIGRHVSQEHDKLFSRTYSKLIDDYDVGQLDSGRVNQIKERNNASTKVGVILGTLRNHT
jgi:hypothetical protein